jgi:hypothetical protein
VAAAAIVTVFGVLAIAGHLGSAASEPARPPFRAPPPCGIAADGPGVDCGSASAAIRTASTWHVIKQGRCIDDTRLYFGVHTANGDAPLALILGKPSPGVLAKGGEVQVTNGQLTLASGATESLAGWATVAPGGSAGAFSVQGRDAAGQPDGHRYAGAWTCRAGHAPPHLKVQEAAQAKLPQCTAKQIRGLSGAVRGGYRLECGPASAIVWAGEHWQVVSPGICFEYDPHFGVLEGLHSKGLPDAHRTLQFFAGPYFPDTKPARNGAYGVGDGEIDVLGAHSALWGRVIFQPGGRGGAFDLNNRARPSAADRADYVGAWTCGGTS